MRKHTDRVKWILAWLLMTMAMLILTILLCKAEYKAYNSVVNDRINQICLAIEEKYPEVDSEEIIQILTSDEAARDNFFRQYAIDLEKDSIIQTNKEIQYRNMLINIILVIFFSLALGLVFFLINRKREKKLDEIAKHIMQLNMGDYSIDMEGFSEGELSALESEVYKTTIMLKEAADNSKKEKERLKESLSDISHQLKTPITSLLINLENLQDYPEMDLEKRSRLIANAKRDTNRISQMVKLLLTLSKLDANVIEFKKEETRIISIVSESVENVAALADLKGIEVSCQIDDNDNSVLVCDSYWEIQALSNVLKNGIEHATSRVIIDYSDCGMYKELIIFNDGKPISSEDQKKVFKRFYSGENASVDSVGIGLSMANAVVKKDGGYMIVESDEDNAESGVKFIMRFLV